MHPKKHLQFGALRDPLSEHFGKIADPRQQSKVAHCNHDCLMIAFAMMLLQDPSLLAFQQRVYNATKQSNFFAYELVVKGKITYRNSWVSDLPVDEHNGIDLVRGGRGR